MTATPYGILDVTDQIRRRAVLERRSAQPVAGGPARRPERVRRRHPDPLQRVDLIADATVRDHAARIGAREYRHTRFARGGEARATAAVKIPHVTGVARVLRGAVGDAGKFSMLISVGTNAVPCSTISARCRP